VRRPPFDWRGLIALVLALGVVGVFIVGEVVIVVNHSARSGLTTEEAETASTILGAVVGALAVYLGGRPPGPGQPNGPESAPQESPSRPDQPPPPGDG
jgi:hypothetical protein